MKNWSNRQHNLRSIGSWERSGQRCYPPAWLIRGESAVFVRSPRARALTRRGLGTASTVIKHGPLSFDATGRVAELNDLLVELSARELSLLEVLLQRAGRLVSKDQLVERLCEWG